MSIDATPDIAAKIESFFEQDVQAFTNRLAEIEHQITASTKPQRDSVLDNVSEAILRARDACRDLEQAIGDDPELIKGVQQQLRVQIAPWFLRSWFMQRATEKPRGYPGDYETLNGIYDGQVKTTGIGGYLDLYFLNTALARAVVSRLKAVKQFLIDELSRRSGEVSVLNVACGPFREIAGGMPLPEESEARFTCIDFDTKALDYVAQQVAANQANLPQVECTRYNALRMSSAKANIKTFGKCDVIYSVGLYDYIPDKSLVAILRGLRETLNEGGVLYAAFKDCRQYDKTEYEWMVDWFFLQRTEQDCMRLLLAAGFGEDDLEVTRDETGTIINFVCRVARPARVRIDEPQEQVRDNGAVRPQKQAKEPEGDR